MGNNYFIFGVHLHQPLGNSPEIMELAYNKAYLPFLKIMKDFKIKFQIHISGSLLLYLVEKHPEFIELIREFIREERIEILGGGFYEPILTMISEKDRIGQIKKYKEYLEKIFNFKIRGMWLAERVWEPDLPSSIRDAGIEYTVVDDYHFKGAGVFGGGLYGYYIVEHFTKSIKVFPIIEKLRYMIPFSGVEETFSWIVEELDMNGGGVMVFMDDGEKFGLWPHTYKHVYEDRWLEKFLTKFSELQERGSLISIRFRDFIEKHFPEGRIYLPTASYTEMDGWSLFHDARIIYEKTKEEILSKKDEDDPCKMFFRPGYWKNMLVKYPEANQLQKRIFCLSKDLDNFKDNEKAKDFIYRSQCNCPFWHGTFGGVYLLDIRQENYSNFIKALKEYERLKYKDEDFIKFFVEDIDCDGEEEIVFGNRFWEFLIKKEHGAGFSEILSKEKELNFSNSITRRREVYHGNDVIQDWYRRFSFLDHFFYPGTKLEDFERNSYGEQGDFVNQSYNFYRDSDRLIFKRNGGVWIERNRAQVEILKEVYFKEKKFFDSF